MTLYSTAPHNLMLTYIEQADIAKQCLCDPHSTLQASSAYNLLPRRPPFRRVESVGMGVTSSAEERIILSLPSPQLL